jgi:putative membrane protein
MIDFNESDFLSVVFRLHGSVVPFVWPWILYCGVMGGVASYARQFDFLDLDLAGMSTIGMLLSFLLVFRVNIAYARYWEARGHVGSGVKSCRDIASQAACFIVGDGADSINRRGNIARLVRLTFSALAHEVYTSGPRKWEAWCRENSEKGELHVWEAKKLVAFKRPFLLLIQWLRSAVMDCYSAGLLQPQMLQQMDTNISNLIVSYNGCTKIVSTPIPFAFAQMSKLFIFLFATLIGFALSDVLGNLTPIVTRCRPRNEKNCVSLLTNLSWFSSPQVSWATPFLDLMQFRPR